MTTSEEQKRLADMNRERVRLHRERNKKAGLVHVAGWVKKENQAKVAAYLARMAK